MTELHQAHALLGAAEWAELEAEEPAPDPKAKPAAPTPGSEAFCARHTANQFTGDCPAVPFRLAVLALLSPGLILRVAHF